MAKLDDPKLIDQLQRQQGFAAVFGAAPALAEDPPSTAKPRASSKRSTWKACTFYLPAETKARLKRVLLQRELTGAAGPADQSEAINEALLAWLEQAEQAES